MVPKDQCEHITQYCIDRNNTWSKLYIERYGPRKTLTVATFTEVLNKLISFMHTEVGLLSWVSHTTIARAIGINKDAVRCYLRAATLIGAVKVKYTYAKAAHEQTIRYYPNYTDHTDGLTFNMMLVSEDGKPRRLNYYTVIGCEHWNGRKYNSLPADWKIEVIRLCSKQKSIHLHEAERLAAKYRIAALDPIINHPTRKPKTQRPIVYVNLPPDDPDQSANTLRKRRGKSKADSHVGPESASANEGVNTTTHKLHVYAVAPESASANEGVRPCVLSTRKQADKGSAPSSSKTESPVRPESASANEGVRPCVLSIKKAGDEGSAPSSAIEEKQEPGAGKPALAVSGEYTRPGHSEVVTPETPSAQQLRREELEYRASYGDATALITLLNEDETLLNENAASGRASPPEPFAAKAAPGSVEVSPPVTPEDTNPARVRLSWGQHRRTAAQSRQDRENATEKQESGAGKPALAVSGEYARPGHVEALTPEKAPSLSSQRSSLIKQHQAYLAREAAMRTQLEQQGFKGEMLEEALRVMMKAD